jgi:hypothetical protein
LVGQTIYIMGRPQIGNTFEEGEPQVSMGQTIHVIGRPIIHHTFMKEDPSSNVMLCKYMNQIELYQVVV